MLLIPYDVDVPMERRPIANYVLIGLITVCFLLQHVASEETLKSLVVTKDQPWGLLTHLWLHADPIHLAGNLLFLWVFGNAINAKVGNVVYPFVYLVLGALAGIIHMVFDGRPAVGASGAINGIVGMFLVLYPRNGCSCFYIFWWRIGTFMVSSFWMILLWLAFDILGAVLGTGQTAYYAHLGGFGAGFMLAAMLLALKGIRMHPDEESLLCLLSGKPRMEAAAPQTMCFNEEEPSVYQPAPWETPEWGAAKAQETASATAVAAATATQESMLVADDRIVVNCSCGKEYRVSRRHAGRTTECPGCGEAMTIPFS